MAYVPQGFQNGEILMAGQLNSMDAQIARNETAAANRDFIANNYDPLATYEKGDLAIYNGTVQVAIVDIPTPEVFTSSHWKLTTMNAQFKETLAEKADIDGEYPDLTVGNAEQINSTQYVENTDIYAHRATGGSADVGNREYLEKIIGGTVCWNQLVTFAQTSRVSYDVTYTWNSDGSVSVSGTATGSSYSNIGEAKHGINGHKVLLFGCPSGGSDATYYLRDGYTSGKKDVGSGVIISKENDNLVPQIVVANGTTVTDIVFKPQFFDLTAMFGPTIADYVYGLEQATAGAGVAWFRRYFPNDYYAYNPGELISVSGLQSHDTVGFNAWDEEWELGSIGSSTGNNTDSTSVIRSKNYIPVIPGARYYIKTSGKTLGMRYYDANKKYLTYAAVAEGQRIFAPNVRYIRFYVLNTTVYNHDICINLSHSGTHNGEYEPHEKHSYQLDPSVTLRGMPKLDENGNLYFNGDEYPSDGQVTRKYGEKTLNGTESWRMFQITTTEGTTNLFRTTIDDILSGALSLQASTNAFLPGYTMAADQGAGRISGTFGKSPSTKNLDVCNNSYESADAFKSALASNPLRFVYELATPTTEQAEPYTEIQICSDWGTEEFVSDSILPVGHLTRYPANLRDKLQHLPSLADADGDYIVRQSGSQMSLVGLGNTNEVTGIKDDISELRATASAQGIYVETESQPIVSISDGADDQPMKAVNVAIEPVQDLHGYDAPWPAGGGKNLLNPELLLDQSAWNIFTIQLKPNTAYTASSNIPYEKTRELPLYFFREGMSPGSTTNVSVSHPVTITTPESGIMSIQHRRASGTDSFQNYNWQIEEGSSASSFAPYSNVCPISGWTGAKVTRTGKNLFLATKNNEDYTSLSSDGVYTLHTVPSANVSFALGTASLKAGHSYILNGGANNSFRVVITYNGVSYISGIDDSAVINLDSDATVNVACVITTFATVNTQIKPMLRLASESDSTFEPYKPIQTYEVTFPTSAGTVYGGTLDVVSGKLVVDRAILDTTWGAGGSATEYDDRTRKRWELNPVQDPTQVASAMCNLATYQNGTAVAINRFGFNATQAYLYLSLAKDTDSSTPIQVCYRIASPQEFTLSQTEIKTLLGLNNVFSDCGDTAITYPADAKTYIDNRINSTRRLIAGIETGFTASKLYAVGDMLIVGDDLYKVTAQIASGATITVGTNVTKTTVAEQLLALMNA